MLSLRPACRALRSGRTAVANASARSLSTPAAPAKSGAGDDDTPAMKIYKQALEEEAKVEMEKSPAQRKVEAMSKVDPHMAWGTTVAEEDPPLPDDPSEIAALDPAGYRDITQIDGSARVVHIRQNQSKVTQGPVSAEKTWVISFMDEGETAQAWDNPLMGWVSSADPMSTSVQTQMTFTNASDAVYFAKKRGWKFIVDEPIYRPHRDDNAQYQDNFLPQDVAALVKRDRTQCNHWERKKAGSSHYFRPLKYHGDGVVRQHGPKMEQKSEPAVEGYYKMR